MLKDRSRRDQETRPARSTDQVIYDAAVRLMCERGYHGTSLRAVAAEVGLQMASLYHHFPSKHDLLVAIMTRTMQDLISTVEEAAASRPDPVERLRAAIRAHVLFHGEHREEAFVADSELRALEPGGRELVVKLRDRYEQAFVDILEDGASQGVLRVSDVKLAVYALTAMCTGVALWYRPGGRLRLDRIADIYADLFLHSVLVDTGGGKPRGGRTASNAQTRSSARIGLNQPAGRRTRG
jgi:AcrR family transcriptional regulator